MNKRIIIGVILAGVISVGALVYWYVQHTQEQINTVQGDIAEIKNLFVQLADNNTLLQEALENEKQKNESLGQRVGDLSSDLGVFKKLSELDPELLKKYSKVYFLSENYVPSGLSAISQGYVYDKTKTVQAHSNIIPFLHTMVEDARGAGVELFIISAYRSFGDQLGLKSQYVVRYGAGTANAFSAEQGYSEHQLGTAVDFTTKQIGSKLSGLEKTKEYAWLQENAHKYGFVLSYPQDNSYYTFEPWHWRFVGKDLAYQLKNEGIYFYNMPQREIDEYLIDIFEE